MFKNNKNEYVVAIITKILMVLIGLGESVLIARYLGADLRGQVSYINSISQTAFIIATLGIYAAYPYFRKKIDKNELINRIMSITIIMFIFYLVVAIILSIIFNTNIEYICIFCIVPILFYDKVVAFLWMIEEPNKRNFVVLICNIIKLLYFVFLYLFAERNIVLGVSTLVIAPIVESIYFTFKLKFKFSFKNLDFKNTFQLISYGFLPMLAVLLTTLNYRIDVIMLRQSSNVLLAEVGIYSIGITLAEKVLLISDAVKEILLSKLAKGKGENEVAKVMRICFVISIAIALCITIISKMFISILYGDEYIGAEVVTNISVWGTIFMVFFKMISQYNVVNHKQKYNVIFLVMAIILNIILNSIFIPIFGINGAALATTIGYLFSSLMFIVYFHKISQIKYRDLIIINKSDIMDIMNYLKKLLKK